MRAKTPEAATLALAVSPVPLSLSDPAQRTVGALLYRGGLAVRAETKRFGGLSGIVVDRGCKRFRGVSDRGWWFWGGLALDAAGDLAAIDAPGWAPILDPSGVRLRDNGQRDAEGLARLSDGDLVVSFEHKHALRRYDADGRPRGRRLSSPLDGRAMPDNAGIEALTALADGRLLAIVEDRPTDGAVDAWIGDGVSPWQPLSFEVEGGFRPTVAATLPDGDVIVLERRVLPPAARLRRVRRGDIAAGARLQGAVLARLDGSLIVDNMEGIDACVTADGETRLLLVSDDNYWWFQRTLMLMFALAPE